MALTGFQRTVVNLIASNRRVSGESYVAGGAALNTLIGAPRLSEDVDIFHDTEDAVKSAFVADRATLESSGYTISVLREWATFVEVRVDGKEGYL